MGDQDKRLRLLWEIDKWEIDKKLQADEARQIVYLPGRRSARSASSRG